jgi:heme oxygenase
MRPELGAAVENATARAILRRQTSEAHARLDALASRLDLSRGADYGVFLAASACALIPLEERLDMAGIADLLPDWPERRRSEAVRADLAGLGLPPLAAMALPPEPPGPDWLPGAAYALEGSRLGARLLLRQVQAGADPLATGNMRYLRHGEGRPYWQSFLAALDGAQRRGLDMTQAVAGALLVLSVFEAAFTAALDRVSGEVAARA